MSLSDAQNQIATNWIANQNNQNEIATNFLAAQNSLHSPALHSMSHTNVTLSRGSTDEDDNAP